MIETQDDIRGDILGDGETEMLMDYITGRLNDGATPDELYAAVCNAIPGIVMEMLRIENGGVLH